MAARKPHALFHGVRTVTYNTGSGNVEAIVLKENDAHNLTLAQWEGGVLRQINDGNPVPQRAPEDYGPEGGGVTWY